MRRSKTSTKPIPGTTLAVGLSAVLIGGLALTLSLRRDALPKGEPSDCPAAAVFEETWDEDARARLRRRMMATEHPQAERLHRSAARALNDYGRAWTRAQGSMCARERRSPEAAAGPTQCLERRVTQVQAWLDVLERGSASTLDHANEAWLALPNIDLCLAFEGPALPASPDLAWLDHLVALAAFGHPDAAAAALPILTQRPGVAPHVLAEALAWTGHLAAARGAWADAEPSLEQSLWLAIETRAPARVFASALALAEVTAERHEDPAPAQRWWRLASAWATRHGAATRLQMPLWRTQARLLAPLGRHAEALDLYAQMLRESERTHGPDAAMLVPDLEAASRVAAAAGRSELAVGLHERARAIVQESWGPTHPRLAVAAVAFASAFGAEPHAAALSALEAAPATAERDLALATLHLQRGEAVAARAPLERALSEQDRLGRPLPERLATRRALADVLRQEGAVADALRLLDDALALADRAYGPRDARGATLAIAAADTAVELDPADAYDRARRVLERDLDVATRPLAWTTFGTAALRLGRLEEAIAALEAAAGATPATPGDRGAIQLALASALWAHGEHDRAQALVADLETQASTASDGPTPADLAAWRAHR